MQIFQKKSLDKIFGGIQIPEALPRGARKETHVKQLRKHFSEVFLILYQDSLRAQ